MESTTMFQGSKIWHKKTTERDLAIIYKSKKEQTQMSEPRPSRRKWAGLCLTGQSGGVAYGGVLVGARVGALGTRASWNKKGRLLCPLECLEDKYMKQKEAKASPLLFSSNPACSASGPSGCA